MLFYIILMNSILIYNTLKINQLTVCLIHSLIYFILKTKILVVNLSVVIKSQNISTELSGS